MWQTTLLTLALSSFSLVTSAPQQSKGNLDQLISSVFGQGQQTRGPETSTVINKLPNQAGGLDDLIANTFTNTSKVTLGTQNEAKTANDDCECVVYYQCRKGVIIKDGYNVIDIRGGFDDDDTVPRTEGTHKCPGSLESCCKPPDKEEGNNNVTPPPQPPRRGCGQRHDKGVGFRITGNVNNEAQFGEFPWMVAVLKQETIRANQTLNVYQCGGALIHRQAVLTAAHCVQGKPSSELIVRAGEWDTQTTQEVYPHQDRLVKSVIIHDKYYPGALFYDFAILILDKPVTYAENVDIVCLPDRNTVFDGSNCFASGWGKDVFGKEGHYQVILKRVELPIVPRGPCQESLRKTRLGKYFSLHESFICAGGVAGQDTCKGDGGSPLVCASKQNPQAYLQAGIVAWGIGCGENETPGVYANVAIARDWIDEQMAYQNLDNTVYNPWTN